MINWRQDWWVLVLIGCFLLVGLSDPIVWHWMGKYWPFVALLCLCIGLAIGALYGHMRARKEYARGFRNGENWK